MNRIALYHLETLIWIARLGTFAAAAERLHTSQAAISARVRELEARTSTTLFQRHGRNMALTVRGRELAQQCEDLWAMAEQVLLGPAGFVGASGIVRIGSGEIAAASFLPDFIHDLDGAFPAVDLEIEIDLTAKLIDRLLDGSLDLVFTLGPILVPGVRTVAIGSIDLLWLASPSTARSLRKGLERGGPRITFWSLSQRSPMHDLMVDAIENLGLDHKSINLCNNVNSIVDLVQRGVGVGLFPANMVADKIAAGTLVPFLEEAPPPLLIQASVRSAKLDPLLEAIFRRVDRIRVTEAPAGG